MLRLTVVRQRLHLECRGCSREEGRRDGVPRSIWLVLEGIGKVYEKLSEYYLGLTVFQPTHVFDRRCTLWTESFEDLLSSLLQDIRMEGEKVYHVRQQSRRLHTG